MSWKLLRQIGMGIVVTCISVVSLYASDIQASGTSSIQQAATPGLISTNSHRLIPGNPADINVVDPDDPAVQLSLQRFRQSQTADIQADNGEEIVFVYNNDLWVQQIDGTGRRALLTKGTDYSAMGYPAWSLDGKSIAFSAILKNDPRVVDLFTANADGSNPVLVTRLNAGYYSSVISSISWSWDHQYIMFVYSYNAADLTTLFVVCTIQRSGAGFATGNRPDVMGAQYEPTINGSRYVYTTLGTPLNYNSDLFVSNMSGTSIVNWWHITTIDALGDVVWVSGTSICAVARYVAAYPNKELLVRFDRPSSITSNVILIYSDLNAKLSSPTFGPTRRKMYMTETANNTPALWYSEWDASWNTLVNVQRGYGSMPNWRQALPLPNKVTLTSPANNATNVTIRPTFVWQSVPGASRYHLKVVKSGGTVAYESTTLTSTSQQVGPFVTGTQHSWTVAAINFAGEGPVSNTYNFTTSLTDVFTMPPIPDRFAVGEAYPNPFNPSTKLSYETPEASSVDIQIVDLQGSHVRSFHEEYVSPGTHGIEWNGLDGNQRSMGSGVYFCRIIARMHSGITYNAVRKMMLIR